MEEQALWAAVLFRAVQDATTSLRHTEAAARKRGPDGKLRQHGMLTRAVDIRRARVWFEKGGSDFDFVCHASGHCPQTVCKHMENIKKGRWRLPQEILALNAARFVNSPTRKARSLSTGPRATRLSDPTEAARPS